MAQFCNSRHIHLLSGAFSDAHGPQVWWHVSPGLFLTVNCSLQNIFACWQIIQEQLENGQTILMFVFFSFRLLFLLSKIMTNLISPMMTSQRCPYQVDKLVWFEQIEAETTEGCKSLFSFVRLPRAQCCLIRTTDSTLQSHYQFAGCSLSHVISLR